jgi:branched-chain amino acid transport system ATP-binding protein
MALSMPAVKTLKVDDLTVAYGPIVAARQVSFEVGPAGLVLILGPNGAGKTSIVSAVAGLVPARRGRIRLGVQDVTRIPAFRRVRLGVALVPEGRGTLPGLTVRENLYLGWRAAGGRQRGGLSDAVAEAVALFPRLGDRLDQDCRNLSGGEMQMLAIARALLSRPHVLLLDEPSLGLAPQAVARVYEALGRLNTEGLAMVIVEQKAVPLARTPDQTLVLQAGRVIYQKSGVRPTEEELAELYLGEAGGP